MKKLLGLMLPIFMSCLLSSCSSDDENKVISIEGTKWVSVENGTTGDAEEIISGKQFGTCFKIGLSKIEVFQTESKQNPHSYLGIYKYESPNFIIEMNNGALAEYDVDNKVMKFIGGDESYGNISFPEDMYLCVEGESTYEETAIDIFTGKKWKLSRLTDMGSNNQFYSGLWNGDQKAMEESLKNLYNEKYTFTVDFVGWYGLNGEIVGAKVDGKGVNSNISGDWNADEKNNSLSISVKITGSEESDALAKAFIFGLQHAYKYEGDDYSLTLFFKDGQTTRVMGFTPQRYY